MTWFQSLWNTLKGFGGYLAKNAGPWVMQAMVFFGLHAVAQKVVSDNLMPFIQSKLSGGPAMISTALNAVGFMSVVTIIVSAYIARETGKLVLKKVVEA